MRRRRREAAHWKANEAPARGRCSSSSSSLLLFFFLAFGTSSPFYCAPTSAAAFSSSTPKHTLRKLMSHVNQAHEWPGRQSAWGQSALVIVVFNNDSSPYGATNCLPVVHNASQPGSQPANTSGDVAPIIHMHLCTFFFLAVFHLVYNFVRSTSCAPSVFPLLARVTLVIQIFR